MLPVLVMFFYRDTKLVELDGRYKGGTSGFDIHEFGILLARKFQQMCFWVIKI